MKIRAKDIIEQKKQAGYITRLQRQQDKMQKQVQQVMQFLINLGDPRVQPAIDRLQLMMNNELRSLLRLSSEEEDKPCGCPEWETCEECQGDTAIDEAEYKYSDR